MLDTYPAYLKLDQIQSVSSVSRLDLGQIQSLRIVFARMCVRGKFTSSRERFPSHILIQSSDTTNSRVTQHTVSSEFKFNQMVSSSSCFALSSSDVSLFLCACVRCGAPVCGVSGRWTVVVARAVAQLPFSVICGTCAHACAFSLYLPLCIFCI